MIKEIITFADHFNREIKGKENYANNTTVSKTR